MPDFTTDETFSKIIFFGFGKHIVTGLRMIRM